MDSRPTGAVRVSYLASRRLQTKNTLGGVFFVLGSER